MILKKLFLKKTTEYGIKNAGIVADFKAAEKSAKKAHMIQLFTLSKGHITVGRKRFLIKNKISAFYNTRIDRLTTKEVLDHLNTFCILNVQKGYTKESPYMHVNYNSGSQNWSKSLYPTSYCIFS